MAQKLEPLGDRVVVQAVEREERTRSGIVLPETVAERPQEGKVVAVGPGRMTDEGKRIALEVKAGDLVVYSKFAGTEFKNDEDEEFIILTERDILAKIS